ncbi:MAG: non-homologous end-joining DNA ligase [Syntrophothermus sp.]
MTEKKLKNDRLLTFGKVQFTVTHLEKVYFPEDNITKGQVLEYYMKIADYILPYLKNRPESMLRHPNGISEKGFFQKDMGGSAPGWAETYDDYSESSGRKIRYLLCNNKATLAYMSNLGCIELNPWHSTIKTPALPNYLIIDLDPSEGNTFGQVVETARVVKDVLDRAGVEGFCKTSGATGLHVYIPIGARYDYDMARDFACLICMMVNEQLPSFTTMERKVAARGAKIYLDCHQNGQGQTIASVYSVRPKKGATVSTPLLWEEVNQKLDPGDFTIFNVPGRLEKKGDLFKGVLGKGVNIMKSLKVLSKI